jgi:hypothetical protein
MPKLNKTTNDRPAKTGRVLNDVSNAALSNAAPVAPVPATVTPIGNRLTAWTDDDTKSTTVDADAKTVTVVRAVRFIDHGPQYKLVHVFDFSNATFGEIAALATSSLVIDVQREIRENKKMPSTETTDVHERVKRARATVGRDPVRAIATAAVKLTPAQRAEQMKMLAEMVAADELAAKNAADAETAKS